MSKLISLGVLIFCSLTFVVLLPDQSATRQEIPFPNELPNLKLYKGARWNSLKPLASTVDDVKNLLGEPVPVLRDRFPDEFGFDYDPDWIIVIDVVGKGGDLPDTLADRVFHINLYPRKRISLVGADFQAFRGHSFTTGDEQGTVYYDQSGLSYVLHSKDSADGRFHKDDLARIIYGPSLEVIESYKNKEQSKPEQNR